MKRRKKRKPQPSEDYWEKRGYPPKTEWGSTVEFEPMKFYRSNRAKNPKGILRRRCQEFDVRKIKKGFRNAEAQCDSLAVSGSMFCDLHTSMQLRTARGGYNAKAKKVKKPVNNPDIQKEIFRYRNSIPPNLLAKFLDAMSDPNKLSLESELAVVTARVDELLQRVDQRQSRHAWSQVIAARDVISGGMRSGDPAEFTKSVTTALSMINKAVSDSDYKVWDELFNAITYRKSLAESERRRQVEERQAVTVDEMVILMGQVQSIIISMIKDDGLRLEIAQRLMLLVNSNPQLLSDPVDGRIKSCTVCSLQDFVERNRDSVGMFTCPMCGRVDKKVKVIEAKK